MLDIGVKIVLSTFLLIVAAGCIGATILLIRRLVHIQRVPGAQFNSIDFFLRQSIPASIIASGVTLFALTLVWSHPWLAALFGLPIPTIVAYYVGKDQIRSIKNRRTDRYSI